jgi:protein-S-isoprenylcysteine O-methyltransferase Ste14
MPGSRVSRWLILRVRMGFFNYFQIAVLVIVLCVIVIKAVHSWSATGVNPIVIGRDKGKWRILEVASSLALILWVVEVSLRAFHSRFDVFHGGLHVGFLNTSAAKTLGVVLVLLGLIPFVLAYVSFGTSWRIGIDQDTPGSLVTGGIFAVTRNPIYVGVILFFFGIFLLNETWFFLVFAVLAVVVIHFQILREEEFLKKQYGDSYAAYCVRAARYLIW